MAWYLSLGKQVHELPVTTVIPYLTKLRRSAVLELGAGCALPSLVAATLPADHTPSLVVATDFPDVALLANLRINVAANARQFTPGCRVACEGYEWGADPHQLLCVPSN